MAPSPTRTNTPTNFSTENNSDNSNTHVSNRTVSQSENLSRSNIQNGAEISATSIKLPQFWTSCPEAWFIHAEMQFATRGVTQDRTKYEYIVTALPQEVIMTVLDFIQNPPPGERYAQLKTILIDRHSMSENKKLDKILSDSEIGDRKPSEFYRSLVLLAGSNFSSDLLKKLWLRKLPKSLNIALTGSNLSDINELIRLADSIWEVLHSNEIASMKESISTTEQSNSSNLEKIVEGLVQATSNICNSFNKLSLEVDSMKRQIDEYQYQRMNNRRFGRSRSRSRGRSGNRNWVCRFHYKYGSEARQCEQPCSFSRQSQTSTN